MVNLSSTEFGKVWHKGLEVFRVSGNGKHMKTAAFTIAYLKSISSRDCLGSEIAENVSKQSMNVIAMSNLPSVCTP